MTENGPPKAKGYDPGWNDPPTMAYSGTPTASRPKLNLNKRIAFPLQTGSPSNNSAPNSASSTLGNMPRPCTSIPPTLPPPIAKNTFPTESKESIDIQMSEASLELSNNETRSYVMKVLRQCVRSIIDTENSEEIGRRLNKLESMWNDNKYSPDVESKLFKIAKAVDSGNVNEANEVHRSLVIDNLNECSQWSTALRHLILTVQPHNES